MKHRFLLILSSFLPSALFAQGGPPAEQGWQWQVDAGSEYRMASGKNEAGVERSSTHTGATLSGSTSVGAARFGFSSGYVFSDYSWEHEAGEPTSMLSDAPYSDIRSALVGADYRQAINGPWGAFARGTYEWSAAKANVPGLDQPSLSDGGRGSLTAGLSYRVSPDLMLSFGGFFLERMERGNLFIPIAFVDWKIDEHWRLRTANGVQVFYDPSADRRHLLSAGVAWESTNFAYAGFPVSPERQGVGKEQAVRASVAWQWNFNHHFAFRPEVSYRFAQEVEFRRDGQRVSEEELKDGFAIGATVSARF